MRTLLRALAVAVVLALAAAGVLGWMLASFLRDGGAAERVRAAVRDATGRELAWSDVAVGFWPPRVALRDARLGAETDELSVAAQTVTLQLALAPLLRREVVVRRATAEDATLRAVPIVLEGVRAEADGFDGAPDLRVRAAGALFGGRFEASGQVTRDGVIRALDATLADVDPGPLAPHLARDLALAGRVAGKVTARGPATALEALDADLAIAEADVRAGKIGATGAVAVKARLAGPPRALVGDFDLDATAATLSAYGGAFVKPPGAPATASGRLVRDAEGRLGVDAVRLQIKNMSGTATGSPGAWRLDLAPFDVARFLDLGRGPFELRGSLRGDANGAYSEGASLAIGGQPVAVVWSADLASAPGRQKLHLAAQGADARALAAALGAGDAVIEGAVSGDASLEGASLDALAGRVDASIGAGRIPGVSPLRQALDGLARYDDVVRVLDREDAERALAPHLGDRFESLIARLDVSGGRAETRRALGWEALVIDYPGYRLALRGSIGLADRALDAKGRVVLEPALEAALAGRPVDPDAAPRVIEIARVGGTLDEPKLEIDQAGAVAFAATLALAQRRDKWERELDDALGEGSGRALLDALDGFLGDKKKERR
jgi:hypothetical protein